jgi:hypothetical protein
MKLCSFIDARNASTLRISASNSRTARRTQLKKNKSEPLAAARQKRKSVEKPSENQSREKFFDASQRFTYTSHSLRNLIGGISEQLSLVSSNQSEHLQPRPFDPPVFQIIIDLSITISNFQVFITSMCACI